MLRIHVLTIFPEILVSPLQESILKRAQDKCLVRVEVHDLRQYTADLHRTTDDDPYGGGPGMIMKVEPLVHGLEKLRAEMRIELREMISQLAEMGKAVLISSHILTELAEICDKIAIIEQGKLLATGTVEEISERFPTITRVHVRTVSDPQHLMAWLAGRPDVSDARLESATISLSHSGSESDQAALLQEMIQADFRIVEFSSKRKSLEDVFLHVTQGVVQ
jgi:ABC-type uncharacterized transport system ATPase subunit